MIILRKHRFAFLLMSLSTIFVAVMPLFLVASCTSLQQTPQELKARESLRAMTRGGVLPGEDAVARIENDYPRTTAGSLAKIVHARIKLKNNDYAGAASLLDSRAFADYTTIGDYALWLRGNALEQLSRRVEARAAYEKLARDFPNSLRAREALLRVAQMQMQDGQAAAVPLTLKALTAMDNPTALLLTAKAYEQAADEARAVASYRRIYYFAPASAESAEAASAMIKRTVAPATVEEAIARAEKLFAAKHYGEAYDAYTIAFSSFPSGATSTLQGHRVIAAANARKFSEAAAALNASPGPTSESRAEAMFNLALAYGHAKQWAQARSTTDELHRAFPNSPWATRAFVQAGQAAEDARDATDASYFYRAAVNFYSGAAEVTPAQFYFAWQAHEGK